MLRGGFSYDSSPVDAEDRLPDVPAAEAFRFAVGLQKHFAENIVGNVGHWGHVHQRANRYEAELTLSAAGGAWKIMDFKVLEQERLPL